MATTQLIDRRLNGRHKSAQNRQRFIRRYKEQIKQAIAESIAGRSITDVASGGEVRIPRRDIAEPEFHYGSGGWRQGVHPGNREFVAGDTIERPSGGGDGQGSDASDGGEGEDDFTFTLTRDEFMDLFFEDLALPNLNKTRIHTLVEEQSVRAGHTHDGVPSNIDIVRSLSGALARRTALRGPLRAELAELEERLAHSGDAAERSQLRAAIESLEKRIGRVPFLDEFDLRYRNRVTRPKPCTQAVMFCLMDVSGSMDEQRKDIAKRFFMLLYHFLHNTYEHIQVVFIRHHTAAQEVDEQEFFQSRDTGGTLVSTALDLMDRIIAARYPREDWNIYAAQASDGDNWPMDSA
ncbi:MAG: YeaH/YhbH family protein, partial [Gammaproteobacteria bacterium]|nr:YeaH/YhbH family protein [Gammaproteobacteria bacterium]